MRTSTPLDLAFPQDYSAGVNCRFKRLLCVALSVVGSASVVWGTERWYVSNAAGMALKEVIKFVALRGEYALCVERFPDWEAPMSLRAYYEEGWSTERLNLYENREVTRVQWIFRDTLGRSRFVTAFSSGDGSGFLECYNEAGQITEERRFDGEGTGYLVKYRYSTANILLGSECFALAPPEKPLAAKEAPDRTTQAAFFVEPALIGKTGDVRWRDVYRYTRGGGVRTIDRVFLSTQDTESRSRFPRVAQTGEIDQSFIQPSQGYSTEFLSDLLVGDNYQAAFVTDSRGRIITETRRDDKDEVLGEFVNVWNGDRIMSITWEAGAEGTDGYDYRKVEYEYNNAGDRIAERDFRQGVLERSVISEGDADIETLYMGGEAVLQTIWKDGRKVSETKPQRAGAGSEAESSPQAEQGAPSSPRRKRL